MDRDVVIVGAGVVGAAIARELARLDLRVTLLEAGPDVGAGTSKANTALLHTGFDAKPGTLESRLVARGCELLAGYAPRVGHPARAPGRAARGLERASSWASSRASSSAPARTATRRCAELGAGELYRREPALGPGALGALEVPDEGLHLPVHHAARVRHRGGARGLRAAPRDAGDSAWSARPAAAFAVTVPGGETIGRGRS